MLIANSINNLGDILFYQGDYELAVKLLSAAENILESMGSVLDKDDQKRKDQTSAKLIEQLSDKEFKQYWEEGKKLTLEQAVGLSGKRPSIR